MGKNHFCQFPTQAEEGYGVCIYHTPIYPNKKSLLMITEEDLNHYTHASTYGTSV